MILPRLAEALVVTCEIDCVVSQTMPRTCRVTTGILRQSSLETISDRRLDILTCE